MARRAKDLGNKRRYVLRGTWRNSEAEVDLVIGRPFYNTSRGPDYLFDQEWAARASPFLYGVHRVAQVETADGWITTNRTEAHKRMDMEMYV